MRFLPVLLFAFLFAQDTPSVELDIGIAQRLVTVPNMVGYRLESIRNTLERARLRLGELREERSEAQKGIVLRQTPQAGDTVPAGSIVDVVISAGPFIVGHEQVVVPPLVGRRIEEAEAMLLDARLNVGHTRQSESRAETGTIIKQNPLAGTRVPPGTLVHLVVAKRKTTSIPWFYGGMAIALGLGGFFVIRHLVKARKYVEPRKLGIQFKPNKDPGVQHVISDTPFQPDLHVRLRPIPDYGAQEIETEKTSIIDEEKKL